MRRKNDVDFQIFVISRFLVSLIFVVMAEFLVLVLINYMQKIWLNQYPVVWFVITILLFVIPIMVTVNMFTKVILDEVQR